METQRELRIKNLLKLLKKSNRLHLRDAAQHLNVSEMTIRRDLSGEPAPVVLLGGYVVLDPLQPTATHYFVSEQKTLYIEEKRYIGQLAATMIKANDVIFFDCGTTSPYIVDAIADDLKFTAICCSLNTFLVLQNKPQCRVILCGGEFKQNNNIFTSLDNHSELNNLCPDKAFISAAGISLTHGLTCFNLEEIRIKNQAIHASQQHILISDHTKFDKVRPARFGDLSQLDGVITNQVPTSPFTDFFEKNNIPLIY